MTNSRFQEYFLLSSLLVCLWLLIFGRGTLDFMHFPISSSYLSDVPLTLALTKSYSEGDITPFLSKFNDRLNAPFVANWNDYPFEDLIYAIPGIFSSTFGLFEGINIYLMLLHVSCGLSFYFVGRCLAYDQSWCFAGAFAFAFSPFLFYRGILHLTVATVWHLPLVLLTLVWAYSAKTLVITEKNLWRLCILTSFFTGILNPYYLAIFLFFLLIAIIASVQNRELNRAKRISYLFIIAVLAFLFQHLDTLIFQIQSGPSSNAVVRDLGGLTTWGLRIPDLILPAEHQSSFISSLFSGYHNKIPGFLRGESQWAYIGMISSIGLILLMSIGTLQIAQKKFDRINHWYWFGLGTFGFAIDGGLNYLAGAFGFVLFRATNRFSIILMLVGLYFLCEILSNTKKKRSTSWVLALCSVGFILWDQIPPSKFVNPLTSPIERMVRSDRRFTSSMENALPNDALVFQLPVHDFPESGPVNKMSDYEHFRPYLYSKSLRFSYGSLKGRGDSDWQFHVANLAYQIMAKKLEKYGFSAIMINRKGYEDGAVTLISDLKKYGYEVIADESDLIAFRLVADPVPILPPSKAFDVEYGDDFYAREVSTSEEWNWAKIDNPLLLLKPKWYLRNFSTGSELNPFNFHVQGLF